MSGLFFFEQVRKRNLPGFRSIVNAEYSSAEDPCTAIFAACVDCVKRHLEPRPAFIIAEAFHPVVIHNPFACPETRLFGRCSRAHKLHNHGTAAINQVGFPPSGGAGRANSVVHKQSGADNW